MPVPKRKVSKSRRDKRASSKKVKVVLSVKCQTCESPVLPHQVCKVCGHYKGVKVIKTKIDRIYKRNQERQKTAGKQQDEGKDVVDTTAK